MNLQVWCYECDEELMPTSAIPAQDLNDQSNDQLLDAGKIMEQAKFIESI